MELIKFITGIEQKVEQMTFDEFQKMYDEKWTISFEGKTVEIPFDAVSYNAITDALSEINDQQ